MERIVLIVQARMGSTRLPGKSMLPLAGAPLIQRLVERARRVRLVHDVLVATTELPADDELAAGVARVGAGVFRGSETDLVDRHLDAARSVDADVIVRVPGDNPVIEPSEIDRIVEHFLHSDDDFSSNITQVNGNGYPDGFGAEVFRCTTLARATGNASDPRLREHPHLNFFDYGTQRAAPGIRVGTIPCPPAIRRPELRLDVNTRADYRFIGELYDALYTSNPEFDASDVVRWWDSRPS